jgi:hypothetical protein
MPKNTTEVTVVLSSPNDVKADRKSISEIVDGLNRVFAERGVRIVAKDWEDGVIGGVAGDGQEVLNAQLFAEVDVFIAIIGNRLGTPTARDVSGTAEEIMYALDNVRRLPNGMNIQVCFRTEPLVVNEENLPQISEVISFKKRLHEKGVLTNSYSSLEDLSPKIVRSISSCVEYFLSANDEMPELNAREKDSKDSIVPTAVQEELGILDYMDQTETSMSRATESLSAIAGILSELGDQTNAITMSLSNPNISTSDKKYIVNQFAQTMDGVATRLESEVTSASQYFADGVNNTIDALALDEFSSQDDDLESLRATMQDLAGTIRHIRIHAAYLTDSIAATPRITKEFNAARRKLADASTQNVLFLDSAAQQLFFAISRVDHVIKNRRTISSPVA